VLVLQEVDGREVAVAYGRRSVPKLLSVIATEQDPEQLAHCLRVLVPLLMHQEQKTEAIRLGAPQQLVLHAGSDNVAVAALACDAIACLSTLMIGREAVVQAGGVESIAKVILQAPEKAAKCLMMISRSMDGAGAVLQSGANVTAALVQTCKVKLAPNICQRPANDAGGCSSSCYYPGAWLPVCQT
jgi:hypothetical protein